MKQEAESTVLVDEKLVLQETINGLREKIDEMVNQKASLEGQLTSLRYSVDNERAKMLADLDKERNLKLSELRQADSDLRARERKISEEEVRLGNLRKNLEDELIQASLVTDREKEFNGERIQIDRMRREAESLMLKARDMVTNAEAQYSAYANRVSELDVRDKRLKEFSGIVNQKSDELDKKANEVSMKISYYEKLLGMSKEKDEKEG